MRNVSFSSVRLLMAIIFCAALQPVFAQNGVAIATGASATADNSAMLDVQSTNKGVLIPRFSVTSNGYPSSPATGLLFYNTDNGYYTYNSGTPGAPVWTILNTGGIGSIGGTANYIAKYNATNGLTISRFFDNGTATGVGIGTASPAALIDINANGALMTAASGAGGNVNITGQNAGGTNQNGGSIILTGGTATGTGTAGGVGIGITTPKALLEVGSGGASGKVLINSQDNFSGQLQIGNPTNNGEASMSFISGVSAFGTTGVNPTVGDASNYRVWTLGTASWGIGGNKFGFGNNGIGGVIMTFDTLKNVAITNLSGTGLRSVYADASGNLHTVNGSSASPYKTTFSSTSATNWNVPAGVTEIFVKLWGAGGGASTNGGATGGGGGFISGWLTIPSGTTQLSVFVGGGGGNGGSGTGGTNGGGGTSGNGGGGGGRSAIQIGAVDYVTAGGGGGAASGCWCRGGGGGGGGTGLNGAAQTTTGIGYGGTQTAVGASGPGGTNATGNTGGVGGTSNSYQGGGGGGWFGGGHGGSGTGNSNDGGGGGGSSGGNTAYFSYVNGQPGQMMVINAEPSGPNYPGGVGDIDYQPGVGVGAVADAYYAVTAGNGYVVIYY